MNPRIGAKRVLWCEVCEESTTQKFGVMPNEESPRWLCSMHDLNPKTPEQIAKIKADRADRRPPGAWTTTRKQP